MTGFNHRPDCLCGWCVGGGRGRSSARHTDNIRNVAEYFLLSIGVTRDSYSCFVNPNARCPVCSQPVYFYSNSFGSRVYFDELGPPWPKHPCTTNEDYYVRAPKIEKRPAAEIREIADNVIKAGWSLPQQAEALISGHLFQWNLILITSVKFHGGISDVEADVLSTVETRGVKFCFQGEAPGIEVGMLASMTEDELSYWDVEHDEERSFDIRSVNMNHPRPRDEGDAWVFDLPGGMKVIRKKTPTKTKSADHKFNKAKKPKRAFGERGRKSSKLQMSDSEREKLLKEITALDEKIRKLKEAWEAAHLDPKRRQKITDQLISARNKRQKLMRKFLACD